MSVSVPAYSYTRLAANATTLVRTGPCVLHAIIINTKGVTANTISVYDGLSASGTLIGTIASTVIPGTFFYDIALATGLTIVIATDTAADITVAWASL